MAQLLLLLFSMAQAFYMAQSVVIPQFTLIIEKNSIPLTVGGQEAPSSNSIPYQVGITMSNSRQTFCSGSLISRRYVLTAAHCFENRIASEIKVVTGEHDLRIEGDEETYHSVSAIIQHSNYTPGPPNLYNDFALLRLTELVTLSDSVGIIKLPDSDQMTFEGQTLTASGWGGHNGGPSRLKLDILQGITRKECQKWFPEINENNLCARYPKKSDITCIGDSGGPLTYTNDDGLTLLVGMNVLTPGGCTSSNVSVFARVSKQLKWIKENSDVNEGTTVNWDTLYGSIRSYSGMSERLTKPCLEGGICSIQIKREIACRAKQCLTAKCVEEDLLHFVIQNFSKNDKSGRIKYEGDIQNKDPSGHGTMFYKDGSKYEGQWINGRYQGQGIFFYSTVDTQNRVKYEGVWENGKRNGLGTLTWKNGKQYIGNFVKGLRHGKGKAVYSSESSVLSYYGDWVEGKRSGKGVMIFSENDPYKRLKHEGAWENDERNGEGTLTWKDGQQYVGNFVNELRHGKGKEIYPNESSMLSYDGEWVDGTKSGKGVLIFKNGARYVGDWMNDLYHGKGKLIYSNESSLLSYDGDWVDDKRSGKGVMVWKSGEKYEGEWLNGVRHGRGKNIYSTEGSVLSYDGDWVEDMKSGKGVMIWKDGDKYDGEWLNDKRHGKGKNIFPVKSHVLSYEGDCVQDEWKGKGVMIWKDGDMYSGDFSDNKLSGKGIYNWKDGRRYEGEWKNDNRHGKGTQFSSDGSVWQQGEWKDGIFVE